MSTTQHFSENSTIHNVRFDSQFTVTHNLSAADSSISFAAKGLLWYLLSQKSSWKLHTWQLAQVYTGSKKGNGIDAIRNMLDELMEAGYIKYKKFRNERGQWQHSYHVYPMPYERFQKMFPEPVLPDVDSPEPVNAHVLTRKETTRNKLTKNPPLSSPPKREPDKPKEPEPPEKSLRSEEEDSFQFLEGTSLSPSQQKRLRDAYPRDQILRALKISERMPIKKGLMNLLCHILKNPAQYEDQQTDKPRCPKQQMALKYNQELAKIDAKLATQNEKLIPNNAVKILIGNGLQQLSLKAYDFESDLKMALEELKTMRKRE